MIVGVALVLISLRIGYQLGTLTRSNLASKDTEEPISEPKEETGKAEDVNEDEDEDEDEGLDDIPDGDLASISAGFLEPCKLVRLP